MSNRNSPSVPKMRHEKRDKAKRDGPPKRCDNPTQAVLLRHTPSLSTPEPANAPLREALIQRKDAIVSIAVHRDRIAKLEARIRTLDALIKRLDGPPKPWSSAIGAWRIGHRGEIARVMYGVLRARGTATANDLATALAKRHGVSLKDTAFMDVLRERSLEAFKRAARKGRVQRTGNAAWKLRALTSR